MIVASSALRTYDQVGGFARPLRTVDAYLTVSNQDPDQQILSADSGKCIGACARVQARGVRTRQRWLSCSVSLKRQAAMSNGRCRTMTWTRRRTQFVALCLVVAFAALLTVLLAQAGEFSSPDTYNFCCAGKDLSKPGS